MNIPDAAHSWPQECSHPAQLLGSPAHRGAQQAESPCRASKSAEPATTTFHADGACNGHGSHNRGVLQHTARLCNHTISPVCEELGVRTCLSQDLRNITGDAENDWK